MNDRPVIALAGNPNVGKSTVFNALTGLHQHTGNWPGKTVSAARGVCTLEHQEYELMDVPGAYSLWAQSTEEEAALEAVCFGNARAVIVVCDGTCLERNLNLVYQILEITPRVAVCVNLLDEAEKRGIRVDTAALARHLGVPVVGCCARAGKGVREVLAAARQVMAEAPPARPIRYDAMLEEAAAELGGLLASRLGDGVNSRFAALRLLEGNPCFEKELARRFVLDAAIRERILALRQQLGGAGALSARMVESIYHAAEAACAQAVSRRKEEDARILRADRLLTGKWTGLMVMALLLALVFFLTLKGANGPSAWLARGFEKLACGLSAALRALRAPAFLQGLLVEGMFRTLSQVVAVMLPPMAIFFPLFTLLEDSGYLPRVAFNLDRCFQGCRACGKQALTMCMGFGCNAAGVIGCRIIDSPRERLIAMLTNALTPCNGRFPTLIAMITLFFAGGGLGGTAVSVGMLVGLVLLSVAMTLLCSRLLSDTLLRGVPSAYTLELPPYRMPQVGRVLIRSVLDRTLFVLGRAAAVAAPAGLVIYLLSHIQLGGQSLLCSLSGFLDPLGRLMGLDGVILGAFLLGFPANEIVLPMIVMAYTAGGTWGEVNDLAALGAVLRQQGWTALTAMNLMLFSLFHFPCSTTLLTLYRESRSKRWTALAAALPTALGMALCILTNFAAKIL